MLRPFSLLPSPFVCLPAYPSSHHRASAAASGWLVWLDELHSLLGGKLAHFFCPFPLPLPWSVVVEVEGKEGGDELLTAGSAEPASQALQVGLLAGWLACVRSLFPSPPRPALQQYHQRRSGKWPKKPRFSADGCAQVGRLHALTFFYAARGVRQSGLGLLGRC